MVRRTIRKIRAVRKRKRTQQLERSNWRYRWAARFALARFLGTRQHLDFSSSNPKISIVIVLYKKAELSFRCLQSLSQQGFPIELIVVNNGPDPMTKRLLGRLQGVRIVQKSHNIGFLRAANEGAGLAQSPLLLFLNNDTWLNPRCLEWAYRAMQEEPNVGAVGVKIIGFDGVLLEAGAAILQDGTTECLGRGHAPNFNRFNYRRDTDYVSGCFLLTPTPLFQKLGGFDEIYTPAYYEDTDYCFRLWKNGRRVIYEPRAELHHFENASSPTSKSAAYQITKNKEVFFQRHEADLLPHSLPPGATRERRRLDSVYRPKKQILYLDDRVPHLYQGSGFPRANQVIRTLCEQGWQVTVFPLHQHRREPWNGIDDDLAPQVRVEWDKGVGALPYFLHFNRDTFDQIWVSRSHNLLALKRAMKQSRVPWGIAPVIYDSEAFVAERNFLLHPTQLLMGRPALEAARDAEIALTEGVSRTVVVNERDRDTFRDAGVSPVHVVGHVVEAEPTTQPFEKRKDFLFLGALDEDESPNVLALENFVKHIWPLIAQTVPGTLHVVGSCRSGRIQRLRSNESVRFWGMQKDLHPHFQRARVFVAPHAIGAGLPLKVLQSAALGVPCVVSPLLKDQLGWESGLAVAEPRSPKSFATVCLSVYQDQERWTHIRDQALGHITREYSKEQFREQVARVLVSDRAPLAEERIPVIDGRLERFRYGPERRPTQ